MWTSRALRAIAITQSDTTTYGQADTDHPTKLKFLQVFAVDGTIKINNGIEDITYTIPDQANGGTCPFLIPGPILKVYSTDTTIADAALIGYV